MNNRSAQAQKTKEKIYKTSIRLFKNKGFDNVTIQDIANASNVSVGLFYNYYKSKTDILLQSYIKADEVFREFVQNELNGSNIKEKIKNYMLFYIDYIKKEPFDFIKILYNNNNSIFIKEGRAMQTLLDNIIDEGIKNGEITINMCVQEITELLYVSMRGLIFHWCLHNGSFDIHQRAERYLDMIIDPL